MGTQRMLRSLRSINTVCRSRAILQPRTVVQPPCLSVRLYARGPAKSRFSQPRSRPVQVAEQQQQERNEELEQRQQMGMRYEEEEKYVSNESGYEAVSHDAGLQNHLKNVYGVLAGTVGVASAGAVASMVTPLAAVPPFAAALGSFVPLLWLSFGTSPQTHSPAFRGTLLGAFGLMSGMAMGPLLGMATSIDPMIVPSALLATTGMFGAMSGMSLMLPKGRLLSLGGPLFGGMLGLMGVGICAYFTPVTSPWYPVLHSVHLYGGLGIFSLFIAYDTQCMIREYEAGNKDTIMAATNMFINIKIIFQQFLMIFIGRSD